MSTLSEEGYLAMRQHRAEFVQNNQRSLKGKSERTITRRWKEQRTNAWLNDWREQWGDLRVVRNYVGIQEAFQQFDKRYAAECKA